MSKRLNLDVDDELYRRFKAHCAREGVTMRKEVTNLIRFVLDPETTVTKFLERDTHISITLRVDFADYQLKELTQAIEKAAVKAVRELKKHAEKKETKPPKNV